MTAGIIIGTIVLYIVMICGVFVIPIGLPGTFIIVLSYLIYALATGAGSLGWWVFATIFLLALMAEGIELLAGLAGARKAKGSWRSAGGAIAGGFIGAIIGVWFGIIGAIPGALLGTFFGAYLVEYLITRNSVGASNVAVGALVGRIVGSVVKIGIGLVMICLITLALVLRSMG